MDEKKMDDTLIDTLLSEMGVMKNQGFHIDIKRRTLLNQLKQNTESLVSQAVLLETLSELEKDASASGKHATALQYVERRKLVYADLETNGASIRVIKRMLKDLEAQVIQEPVKEIEERHE